MSNINKKVDMNGRIMLRNMNLDDLKLFRKWLYKPHVARWFHHPEAWIEEIQLQDSKFSWIHHFIVEYKGQPIGFCQYYACGCSDEEWEGQDKAGSYSIDYLIGDTEFLQCGFGKQIVAALTEMIQSNKDACRILVQPEPENVASCSLLNSCGFTLNTSTGIYVKPLIEHGLRTYNQTSDFKFRYAQRKDTPLILKFIKDLALYEKMENEVVATEELLEEWIFDKQKAEVIFAVVNGKEIGFALFFHNFSTFLGRAGLYLEDLFVAPEYRGQGYGKAILKQLAKIAVERGCGRLEWWCLDWNKPSIDFYLSLGAEPMKDWTVYRIAGKTLEEMAGKL